MMKTFFLVVVALASSSAWSAKCPTLMIIVDHSGSMNSPPDGIGGKSKMELARLAVLQLVQKYSKRMPIGLTVFSSTSSANCNDGVEILVEPAVNSSGAITSAINMIMAEGGTNTGEAVAQVADDPIMMDSSRPGSYILLITDGQPNCALGAQKDPAYTVTQIDKANKAGIKTFVIGFGQLPPEDALNMDAMAAVSGEPCMGSNCKGHKFYAAEDETALQNVIDTLGKTIAGEFELACDDSCYGNGCRNTGDICVNGECHQNPCANVLCTAGEYCYTNGTSGGNCVPVCPTKCDAGQICSFGNCIDDPCLISCPDGEACKLGMCVPDNCSKTGCGIGRSCIAGSCIDDPCNYILCPQGAICIAGSGSCESTADTGVRDMNINPVGCGFGELGAPIAAPCFLALFFLWRRRRRQGVRCA